MKSPAMCRAVAALALFYASAAHAEILDQSYDPGIESVTGLQFGGATVAGQVFTVGKTGNLTRIETRAFNVFGDMSPTGFGPMNMDLLRVTPGDPFDTEGELLASASAISISFSSWDYVSFDISQTPVPVVVGDVLLIRLSTAFSSSVYRWAGSLNNPYADGRGVLISEGNLELTSGGADFNLGFRTYVVPEPTSISLGAISALSLVGVALAKRRRRAGKNAQLHAETSDRP